MYNCQQHKTLLDAYISILHKTEFTFSAFCMNDTFISKLDMKRSLFCSFHHQNLQMSHNTYPFRCHYVHLKAATLVNN